MVAAFLAATEAAEQSDGDTTLLILVFVFLMVSLAASTTR